MIRTRPTAARAAAIVLVVAAMTTAGVALAEEPAGPTARIGTRVFGADDGLTSERGEVVLGPVRNSLTPNKRGATPQGWTFSKTATFRRGTSYAKTTETVQLKYTGRSRAMANVYTSTKRVIRASFKYSRGGRNLISWRHSNANLSGACSWTAGSEVSKSVWDSLNPFADPTKFHFDFLYLHPDAC